MKILITAGTTGQAHKLKRLLNNKEEAFVFADQEEIPGFMSAGYRFIRIPEGDSFSFAHELLKYCLDEEIDCVFPLRKAEIKSLAEAVQLFEEYGIKIIIPSLDIIKKLLNHPPAKGSLTVVINGSVYVLEDKNTALPDNLHSGVFMINPENEPGYRIFTAD